jgi:hypothetical protein
VNYVGECSQSSYLCGRCEAGCTVDDDCQSDLVCLERNATEHVPGCFHEGNTALDMKGKNVCYDDPSKPELLWYGNCNHRHPCPKCGGGCEGDYECKDHLRCAKRYGLEDVPGCRWGSNASYPTFLGDWSYCEFIVDMFNICSSYSTRTRTGYSLYCCELTFLANEY